MATTNTTLKPADSTSNPSRLLRLPAEIQLMIYELAVVENEPLLLNCGCESTYGGDFQKHLEAVIAWVAGERRPPSQPSLTFTCRSIRADALPMFYGLNTFHMHYCDLPRTQFDQAFDWLKLIGQTNRRLLRDVRLHDGWENMDTQRPEHIRTKCARLMREFEGVKIERLDVQRCCEHKVDFENEDDPLESVKQLLPLK